MALVQVSTLGGEGAAPGVTAAASQTNGMTPRWQVVAGSFAAISVAWLVSITINATFKPPALVIPAGIGLFAMLYAVTQGLERLLEPPRPPDQENDLHHRSDKKRALLDQADLRSAGSRLMVSVRPSALARRSSSGRAGVVPPA